MSNSIGSPLSGPILFDPYGAARQQAGLPASGQQGPSQQKSAASPLDRVMLSAQAQAALNASRGDAGVLGQAQSSLPAVGDVMQDFLKSMGGDFDFGGLDLKALINKQLLEPAATAIAQLPKDGSSVAGAGYLALEGISVTMKQSSSGIDISVQKISLKAAIAYGSDGKATFSGFAAEVSTSKTDFHIGGGDAGGSGKTPALVLQPVAPGDPKRLDDAAQHTEFGYIPDLQHALETMQQINDAWRALLDKTLGKDRETDQPAIVVLRDRQKNDNGDVNLLFDLFQPLRQSPRADSSA